MSLKCSDYPNALNPLTPSPPPKIAHLIQYGFETDILEILLSEVYDQVDKFFIVESELTHFGQLTKPLVWPLLSRQTRFQPYLSKIVYLTITNEMIKKCISGLRSEDNKDQWGSENCQEILRFQLFLKWNQENGNYFTDYDIIGFGDTDEIPSFHNLILLKKCKMKGTTDIGIWFTFSQINKFLHSDFPVSEHPETLGDPTYWYLKDAKKDNSPSRNRGSSNYFLLGGIHMTRYGYLPNYILKDMTQTENEGSMTLAVVRRLLDKGKTIDETSRLIFFEDQARKSDKYMNLNSSMINKPPFMVPWIMQCNPLRYPSFLPDFPPDKRIE